MDKPTYKHLLIGTMTEDKSNGKSLQQSFTVVYNGSGYLVLDIYYFAYYFIALVV